MQCCNLQNLFPTMYRKNGILILFIILCTTKSTVVSSNILANQLNAPTSQLLKNKNSIQSPFWMIFPRSIFQNLSESFIVLAFFRNLQQFSLEYYLFFKNRIVGINVGFRTAILKAKSYNKIFSLKQL